MWGQGKIMTIKLTKILMFLKNLVFFHPTPQNQPVCVCIYTWGGGLFWEEYTEKLQNKDLLNFYY